MLSPMPMMPPEHTVMPALLEAEALHAAHHVEDTVEGRTVLHLTPGCAHAKTRGAMLLGRARCGHHFVQLEHRLAFDGRVVMRRLRTIRAILRATAGLHAEQRAQLDFFLLVKLKVHGARSIHQLEQG
jgi:hypothetical protein